MAPGQKVLLIDDLLATGGKKPSGSFKSLQSTFKYAVFNVKTCNRCEMKSNPHM